MSNIKTIDNFIPKDLFNVISSSFVGPAPWYFQDENTYTPSHPRDMKSIGLSHVFINNKIRVSKHANLAEFVPHFALAHFGMDSEYEVTHARAFLFLPGQKELDTNIDLTTNDDHLVMIINVYGEEQFFKVGTEKIKLEKNKLILFDGKIEHAFVSPKESNSINFKFNCIKK